MNIVKTYDYKDETGELLYQAVRLDPKDFRQRRPDGLGGWSWSLEETRRVLYRLPELLAADPLATVYIVEGEKDVDALRNMGFIATSNVGGAGKWKPEYSEILRGRNVIVMPDNDEPGQKHLNTIAETLQPLAATFRVLRLPNLPEKGDVSDWIEAGGTAIQLTALAANAMTFTPPKKKPTPVIATRTPRTHLDPCHDPVQHVLSMVAHKGKGGGWIAKCPAHNDSTASLSIGTGEDGRALLHCFAGCSSSEICSALGIKEAELFVPKPGDAKHACEWNSTADANALLKIDRKADCTPVRKLSIRSSTVTNPEIVEPPAIIEGLLRRGEIANLIASPKMRKSWSVHDLAFCVANGSQWLGRFDCKKSKVLLIDNELREWQLSKRFETMRKARRVQDSTPFDFIALRDDGVSDIYELCRNVIEQAGTTYDFIILDALYRFFPADFDENSNADWTRLYNVLDHLSRETGAAILNVHHASKGDQNSRSTTDSGAGGGAQSRAADVHMVLRAVTEKGQPQTEAPDTATLSAVVRGFAPIPKIHLKWNFPFWEQNTKGLIEDDRKTSTAHNTETYAQTFGREVWESRATIEARAMAAGLTQRLAKDMFGGAVAEARFKTQSNKEGRQISKLYSLPADIRPF